MPGTVLQRKTRSKAPAKRAYSEMRGGKAFCAMRGAGPGMPRQEQAACGLGKCLSKATAVGDPSFPCLGKREPVALHLPGVLSLGGCCARWSAGQPGSQLTTRAAGG